MSAKDRQYFCTACLVCVKMMLAGSERARLLNTLADKIEANSESFVELETLGTGRPCWEVEDDVAGAVECFRFFAGIASTTFGQHVPLTESSFGYTRKEPLGACVGIGAWNYPVLGMAGLQAPPLHSFSCTITCAFLPELHLLFSSQLGLTIATPAGLSWKLGPAIACGNTFTFKPAEVLSRCAWSARG